MRIDAAVVAMEQQTLSMAEELTPLAEDVPAAVDERLAEAPLRGDHQRSGARWMLEKEMRTDGKPKGGILGDEVGMGKTFVTLAVVFARLKPRTLIVTPVATTFQWRREIVDKFPQLRDHVTHVVNNHTSGTRGEYWRAVEVVITSYENLRTSPAWIRNTHWDRVVLDEGHVTRNANTQVNNAMRHVRMDVCWILTATPVHNDIRDLVSLLRTCRVMPPSSSTRTAAGAAQATVDDEEEELAAAAVGKKKKKKRTAPEAPMSAKDFDRLRALQEEFMLRRTVSRECVDNPYLRLKPLTVTVVTVDWRSAYERELYDTLRKVVEAGGLGEDDGGGRGGAVTVQSIVYMRQLCVSFHVLKESISKKTTAAGGGGATSAAAKKLSLTEEELRGYSEDEDGMVREDAEARAVATASKTQKKKKQKTTTTSSLRGIMTAHVVSSLSRTRTEEEKKGDADVAAATTTSVSEEKKMKRERDRLRRHRSRNMMYGVVPRSIFHDPKAAMGGTSSAESFRAAAEAADPEQRRKAIKQEVADIPLSPQDGDGGGTLPLVSVFKHVTAKYVARRDLPHTSSKMQRLQEILHANFADPATQDDKVIVFTTFIAEMREVCKHLYARQIGYTCISGDMNTVQRDQNIHGFHVVPGIKVLVAQINCTSTGINLQCANVAVITSPTWNPCIEEQAIGRIHRQGQTKPVRVYRMEMRDSIESHCMERQHDKTLVIDNYVTCGGSRADTRNSRGRQQP